MKTVLTLPPAQLAPLARGYAAAVAAKRRWTIGGIALLAVLSLLSGWIGQVDPVKFWSGLPRFASYFYDIVPRLRLETFFADIAEWFWNFDGWLALLWDTLLIAYVGTLFGAIAGFFLCFLASANVTRSASVRFGARRTLEFCRTVPEIVFALMFVYAFGFGPMPGVLAIAIHTAGALGKQFSEVVENVDMQPVEGMTATGASYVETIRFGVVPQILSNFVSYTLLRFEINVRGATVLGFVGAGGIGKELISSIRQFYYADVSAILLIVIGTVFLIDWLTELLRHRLLSLNEAGR
ncbi:MAG: phosphonate ABC transporter, permease protein PhnE [Reyranella sp.]|nr:phosphonate ABC transporter, permease protein PhnE [Reyranella sp.]